MEHYYVNNNALPTGIHEVHIKNCIYFPTEKTYLGTFTKYDEAIEKAKKVYEKIDVCEKCLSSTHE